MLKGTSPKELFEAIENDNVSAVENCIKRGTVINSKDVGGRTPLHYAVFNGNIDVVRTLLKNGAEVAKISHKGNTPLHIACLKGYKEVVEILLQHVSRDELNGFINARTTSGGTTSLHVAAKNGSLEIVKSLLKHGAIYNAENNEDKTPINLSKDQEVINFLKLVEELFEDAKIGHAEIINRLLMAVKQDEFLALTNARNNQGNSLMQVAIANGRTNVTSKLLKMLKVPDQAQSQLSPACELDQLQSQLSPECELDQLKKLKGTAKVHIEFSNMYLRMLRGMSQPYGPDKNLKNPSPWKTLKEGSYYLGNAYKLVKQYKECSLGLMDDKNIQSINDMLVYLEFDPEHISSGYTEEAYGGQAKCFVSKGQGTKYYKILHSEFNVDVRSFIKMVELNIDIPVKRFIESIDQRIGTITQL